MTTPPRRSIARPAEVAGTGLHSGAKTRLTFRPAKAGHGIQFRRVDQPGQPPIPARHDHVSDTERRTVLGTGEASVSTVEHVLAAAAAHGLDDLIVELDGPEPPNGDGSAKPFFDALAEAGIASLEGAPTEVRLTTPLTVREGDARYVVAPGDALRLTVTIEWPHPLIGRQSGCFDINA
jgi:UDP-3-O-acyl-N-acetylglucosamine deacetylase